MQRLTRRPARLVLAVVVLAAGPVLSACDSLDSLELFDSKKKIAGERREVFPDGVPGVTKPAPQRTASKPAPKPQTQPDPPAAPTRVAAPEPAQQPPPSQVAPWPVAQPQVAWPGSPGTVAR